MAGHIYMQVRSMLPSNTSLAQYLRTIPSLLYPPGRDFLPKHNYIPDYDMPRRRPDPILPYGTWVRVKKGLYTDDVAVLYPIFPRDMVITPKDHRTAFMVPRKDVMTLEPDKDVPPHLRPPLSLFLRAQINNYVNDSEGRVPLQVHCPQCGHGSSCSHSDERKFAVMGQQNVWIQCGLRMWTVSKDHIEVAKSISSEALNLFLESGHPALRNREVLTQIPPVLSWQFFATDKVRILAKAWPELLPWCPESTDTNWVGEGVVQEVDILSCMVLVNSELQSIPKTRLRRQMAVGMMVELLPGAAGIIQRMRKSGVVARFDDISCVLTVD